MLGTMTTLLKENHKISRRKRLSEVKKHACTEDKGVAELILKYVRAMQPTACPTSPSVWLLPMQRPPTINDVFDVLLDIFLIGDLSSQIGIIAMIYLDRLLVKVPGLYLDTQNWKKLILGTLILSSKVWDDATIWNEDFLSALPSLTIQELGMMEHQLLKDLDWELTISGRDFAVYQLNLLTLKHTYETSLLRTNCRWNNKAKCLQKEGKTTRRRGQSLSSRPTAKIVPRDTVAAHFETVW